MLGQIARNESVLEPAELIAVARRTAQVASEISDRDPGKMRNIWLASANEMRDSALRLAQVTLVNDQPALAAAALRLDSACVKCHHIFRQ